MLFQCIELGSYRKSFIRSQPCIISDSNFPRLVLEVHQKILLLEEKLVHRVIGCPIRTLKHQKKLK